jgi:serine/threonine protein kinase
MDDLPLESFSGEFDGAGEFGAGASAVRLFPLDDPRANGKLASWSLAAELSHPNVERVLRTGRTEVADTPFIYAVLEKVEDRLGELIPDRPLSKDEAKDVTEALVSALSYLHAKGLAHGAVAPSSVVASGGRVKLAADTISTDGTAAQDIRDLGATIVEVLTQKRPRDASDVPRHLPSPFREVAVGCLSKDEWDIARVKDALEGKPLQAPPRPFPLLWVAAGVAVLVLIAAFAYVRRPDPPAPPPSANVERQAPRPSPVEPVEPPPPVAKPRREPAREVSTPSSRARSSPAGRDWGVVAAAYNSHAQAQQRADTMARRYAGFRPHVFPEEGQGRKYYVVLGSGLSSDEASDLLSRARSAGLPSDSYVTRIGAR